MVVLCLFDMGKNKQKGNVRHLLHIVTDSIPLIAAPEPSQAERMVMTVAEIVRHKDGKDVNLNK